MNRTLKSILAVAVGLVSGMVLIALIEYVGHLIYPLPEGIDPDDMEALRAAIADLPPGAFLIVILAWGIGALGGGWLASMIAGGGAVWHALVVGVLLLAGAVINLAMIPHPLWFQVVGVLLFIPAAYLGARLRPATRAR